jgi:outer membrane protein OmpU
MNKLKKLGLTALAGSLAVTAANATEYSVTGDAMIKYSSVDSPSSAESVNGKGIGVDTDLYFNASGEMDNGFTVAFFQAANTDSSWSNSSSQVTIGMGGLGTLKVNNVAGAAGNGIDDVMPAAYNETWDGLALTTDNPSFFGSSTASGSVTYSIPTQEMMGLTINASVDLDPSADVGSTTAGGVNATSQSGKAYVLKIAHESGLEVGAGQETVENATAKSSTSTGSDEENVTAYAKFSSGPFSIGMQEAYANAANGAADTEATFWAVAYTAGDFSVSYGESTTANHSLNGSTVVERELESLQATYTMGAMTLGAALAETANAGGTAGRTYEETELSVSFAF